MLAGLTVNHKRAPLNVLDTLTLRNPAHVYGKLRNMESVKGSIILQTCNRVEFYLDCTDGADPSERLLEQWSGETGFDHDELKRLTGKMTGDELVKHLVRVGSGLESMLVGEPQILKQLKDALEKAEMEGATSPILSDLFERSIRAASHLRQETGIGKGTVSLGSAAIRLAEAENVSVQKSSVLLVGTGHVGMLMMKALKSRKAGNVTVAGRNYQRTIEFCHAHGGTPVELHKIQSYFSSVDIIIFATKASSPIVTRNLLSEAGDKRGTRKLVILDLSTPRNVSSEVDHMKGVTVKTLEDVRGIADATLSRRKEIVKQAGPLADQRADEVISFLRRESAEPIVSEILHRADMVRSRELEKAASQLHLTIEERKILEKMSVSLVEKILGPPAGNLRKAAEKGDQQVLTAAGHIFKGE